MSIRTRMSVRTIWCHCVVCEWKGLVRYGETLCNDCGNFLTSQCYAGIECKVPACMFLEGLWTCIAHVPVCQDEDACEQWSVAQVGHHEVIEVEGYTYRGVGGLHMVVLTLSSGQRVSVPTDAVFIASERRQRLPAGAYGHALWFTPSDLGKEQHFDNLNVVEKTSLREELPPVKSTRWDYRLPSGTFYTLPVIPLFRELNTPTESYRWVIRYTPEDIIPIITGT